MKIEFSQCLKGMKIVLLINKRTIMRISSSCLVLALFLATVAAQARNVQEKSRIGSQKEELVYEIKYGFIKGGEATYRIHDAYYNTTPINYATFTAVTTGVADVIYKVRDVYQSYFDKASCMPYMAIRNVSEGGYKLYNEQYFYEEPGDSNSVYTTRSDSTFTIPKNIFDVVSSFEKLRVESRKHNNIGDTVTINTFFDDEVYPFHMRYKGTETIKSNGERIKCHRFDPVTEPGRLFKTEDDMSIYISADERSIPVLLRIDLVVGSVKMELMD